MEILIFSFQKSRVCGHILLFSEGKIFFKKKLAGGKEEGEGFGKERGGGSSPQAQGGFSA